MTKGKTATYYANNPEAKAKKLAYDKDYQKRKRKAHNKTQRETSKKRRELIKKGVNLTGKDIAHTKSGLKVQDRSKNRGSKTAQSGDRRARGGK